MTAKPLPLVVIELTTPEERIEDLLDDLAGSTKVGPLLWRQTVNGYPVPPDEFIDVTLVLRDKARSLLVAGLEPLFPTELWVNGTQILKVPGLLRRTNPYPPAIP